MARSKPRKAKRKGRKAPAPKPKAVKKPLAPEPTETYKQKKARLKKAKSSPLPLPKGTKVKTKRGLRARAKYAAIRMIAERDKITIKEATKRHKKAIVEIVWASPQREAHRKFYQVSPGKWLEVEKGKPVKDIYTFGKVRDAAYIKRVHGLYSYWGTVHLLSESWGISAKQARAYFKKVIKQFGKKEGLEYILIDLGLYEEAFTGGKS